MAANAITFDMQLHAAKYNGACHLNALPPHGMPLNAITFDMAHEICRQDGMSLGGIGMLQQHGAASCCMTLGRQRTVPFPAHGYVTQMA